MVRSYPAPAPCARQPVAAPTPARKPTRLRRQLPCPAHAAAPDPARKPAHCHGQLPRPCMPARCFPLLCARQHAAPCSRAHASQPPPLLPRAHQPIATCAPVPAPYSQSRTHAYLGAREAGADEEGARVVRRDARKTVVSWTTLVSGYTAAGDFAGAVEAFRLMQMEGFEPDREGRVRPNGVTFIRLLSACSHSGLLDEGMRYFHSMMEVYGVELGIEHYGCVVDLQGRSGRIKRALDAIRGMSLPADDKIRGLLLSACRSHDDVDTAVVVVERLVELEPGDVGNLVMLVNVYAAAGRWGDVTNTRKEIRSRSMRKTP